MTRRRKILLGSALSVVLLVVVAAELVLVYLNSSSVKFRIQAAVSEKLGAPMTYDRIELSLLPRPRAAITQLHIQYPHTFRGTLERLTVYPQLLPLFTGKLRLARIQIQQPDFRIILPAAAAKSSEEAPSLEEMKNNIRSLLGYLALVGPGLVAEMDDGKFLFRRSHRDFLALKNVSVHFNAPPGDMHILVKAGTEKWGDFYLRAVYAFSEERTEIRDLTVALGHSRIANFSATLTWGAQPRLAVLSGSALYELNEIYRWLASSESLTPFLKELSSIRGRLVIASMRGEGPPFEPEKWRMRMTGEFQEIHMESPRLPVPVTVNSRFAVEDNLAEVTDFSARFGASTITHVTARLVGRTHPELEVQRGTASIDMTQIFAWRSWHPALENVLKDVDDVGGRFTLTSLTLAGPLEKPEAWKIHASGALDHIIVLAPIFPGPVGLLKGDFRYSPGTLAFALQHATVLDSTITGSAIVTEIPGSLQRIDVTLEGSSGRQTLDWVFEKLRLSRELMTKTPLALTGSHFVWDKTEGASFSGTASVAQGPSFYVNLSQHGPDLIVRKLLIKDQETNATLALTWRKQAADLIFSGNLAQSSLGRIFEHGEFGHGSLQGHLRAVIHTDQPLRSRIKGALDGRDIFIPWGMPIPTTIDKIVLHAEEDVLTVDSADVTWGSNHYSLNGAMTTSDEGLAFSMVLKADGIDIQAIQQALEKKGSAPPVQEAKEENIRSFPLPPIRGDLTADSAYIKLGRFLFAQTQSIITVAPGSVNVELTRAKTCGISLSGAVLISRESISFIFTPSTKNEPLGPTIDCFSGRELNITGDYDFSARIQSHGTMTGLIPAMEGRVDFKSKNGKIYQYPLLAKILSVLSVFEVFRGRMPELGGSGLPYNSMALRGDIHQGIFTIEKAYIGTKSIDIIAEGEVDLVNRKIEVVVLVAPFSGINWLIRHTPVLGKIMGGTLISIPTRVSGDLTNPDVVPLSPTAVGSRILKMFENIIKAPVDLVSPLFSTDKDKEKEGKH
ncbi:MAG TPA: AsmA-like C-terminal domain-containing protein [Nitrospirota bacterium]|nr:AsmA-like C-terminal domain-containing protein [Nitrospirota bacterium]